jgi:hypothetical protein
VFIGRPGISQVSQSVEDPGDEKLEGRFEKEAEDFSHAS